jgi:hypothetical protein
VGFVAIVALVALVALIADVSILSVVTVITVVFSHLLLRQASCDIIGRASARDAPTFPNAN